MSSFTSKSRWNSSKRIDRGFRHYIFQSGLTKQSVIQLFRVTERTYSNWERYGPPDIVYERLSLVTGDHPSWRGYKVLDGQMRCPNGDLVTKHQIQAHYWLASALSLEAKRAVQVEKLNEELFTRLRSTGIAEGQIYSAVANKKH